MRTLRHRSPQLFSCTCHVFQVSGRSKYISVTSTSNCTNGLHRCSGHQWNTAYHSLHVNPRKHSSAKTLFFPSISNAGQPFSSNAKLHDNIDDEAASNNYNHRRTEGPHCRTCTCATSVSRESSTGTQDQNTTQAQPCHLAIPLLDPNTPLPPPLPSPTYSYKKRVLPSNLTAFTSPEGKRRFIRALTSNYAEAYYPLSQQFMNQSDPAYCGVTTLVVVLNALAMDPNVRWRGGWRWYGDETMLLERCCLEEERVRREGISIEMFGGLARCQGVTVTLKRPMVDDLNAPADTGKFYKIDEFRNDIIDAVKSPPKTEWNDNPNENNSQRGYFLVTSFSRGSLQQTGDGHFSPIAAYDPDTDSCLVLDVARFKYAPYWVTVQNLYNAMMPYDSMTGKSRGWIMMFSPHVNDQRTETIHMSIEEKEGKRPAVSVPTAGSGIPLCPIEKIKKQFCPNSQVTPQL